MKPLASIEKLINLLKFLLPVVFVLLVGGLLYTLVNSPKTLYGKLPLPLIPNSLVGRPIWNTTYLKVTKKDRERVFKVKERGFSQSETADISRKLGFVSTPETLSGETLVWREQIKNLSINKLTGRLEYHDASFGKTNLGRVAITEKELRDKVQAFTTSLNLGTEQVDFENPKLKFLRYSSSESEAEEVSVLEANLVVINYPVKINGNLLLSTNGPESLEAKIVGNGQVVGLEYTNLSVVEEENTTYPLKGMDEIKKSISRGEAGLVRIEESVKAPLTNPQGIAVGEGNTFFYNDRKTNYIQPVFVFQVVLLGVNNKSEGEIYLPAIAKKYFK